MNNDAARASRRRITAMAALIGALLLVPFISMRTGRGGFDWSPFDFAIAAVLLGSVAFGVEMAMRTSGVISYRLAAICAVGASFLLVWVNLAVGFLGDENNLANLMFLAVLAVALVGSIIARFQASGMARAMLGAAAVQAFIGVIAIPAGLASPGADGLYEVIMGTSVFTALWLGSAFLFHTAARGQTPARTA